MTSFTKKCIITACILHFAAKMHLKRVGTCFFITVVIYCQYKQPYIALHVF